MSGEKGVRRFVHMGTISLMTVLLVVMLVVLALLVLSGARQDYDYSMKLAQRKTEFYEAHNQAVEILREVKAELQNPTPDFSGLPVLVAQEQISWQVPLENGQNLTATIGCYEANWAILEWKVG